MESANCPHAKCNGFRGMGPGSRYRNDDSRVTRLWLGNPGRTPKAASTTSLHVTVGAPTDVQLTTERDWKAEVYYPLCDAAPLQGLTSGRVMDFPLVCRYQKVYVFLVADRYLDFAGFARYEVDAVLR